MRFEISPAHPQRNAANEFRHHDSESVNALRNPFATVLLRDEAVTAQALTGGGGDQFWQVQSRAAIEQAIYQIDPVQERARG